MRMSFRKQETEDKKLEMLLAPRREPSAPWREPAFQILSLSLFACALARKCCASARSPAEPVQNRVFYTTIANLSSH